jgi:hypothetical protein
MANSSKVLVIIPCGKSKIWTKNPNAGPVMAKDAYVSNYFRLCRLYAERFSDKWLILSGKYGAITPDYLLDRNYDKRLRTSESFRTEVRGQLKPFISKKFNEIVSLCGHDYSRFLQDILKNWGLIVCTPLEGLRIGSRQNRLKECLVKNEPF